MKELFIIRPNITISSLRLRQIGHIKEINKMVIVADHWINRFSDNEHGPAYFFPLGDGTEIEFNPFLNLREPERERLAEWLLPLINKERGRAIKATDRDNFVMVLGTMVANAMAADKIHTTVHYPRGRATYVGRSVYHPDGLSSKLLLSAMNAMTGLRYLYSQNEAPRAGGSGERSRYVGSKKLLDGLGTLNITEASLVEDVDAKPVVILEQKKGKWINYDPARPVMEPLIGTLRAYNRQLREADIKLELPAGVESERDKKMSNRKPELKRLFKGGNLEKYGRFHGGWWQNIEGQNRQFIKINGNQTTEKDFSGCSVRMIYHKDGIDYRKDPYDVPEIKAACQAEGLEWKVIRNSIKEMTQIVFNSGGRYQMHDRFVLPEAISNIEGFSYIHLYHHAISRHFNKKEANIYMNYESNICNNILKEGVSNGIIVLPIYDSFIVQSHNQDWLTYTMNNQYKKETDFDPIIH